MLMIVDLQENIYNKVNNTCHMSADGVICWDSNINKYTIFPGRADILYCLHASFMICDMTSIDIQRHVPTTTFPSSWLSDQFGVFV